MDALKSLVYGTAVFGGIALVLWVFVNFHPWPLWGVGALAALFACHGLGECIRKPLPQQSRGGICEK